MYKLRQNGDYAFGLWAFISAPHLAVAFMFSMGMIFWPASSFPPSYDLMFSLAPKWIYGILTFLLSLGGFWAVIDARRQSWQMANLALAIAFFGIASLFVLPGSITGVSTYSIMGGLSLAHTFDKWIPIGFRPKTKK